MGLFNEPRRNEEREGREEKRRGNIALGFIFFISHAPDAEAQREDRIGEGCYYKFI